MTIFLGELADVVAVGVGDVEDSFQTDTGDRLLVLVVFDDVDTNQLTSQKIEYWIIQAKKLINTHIRENRDAQKRITLFFYPIQKSIGYNVRLAKLYWASQLGAGGKPSTWSLPGELCEQNLIAELE